MLKNSVLTLVLIFSFAVGQVSTSYPEIADRFRQAVLTENRGYEWLKELCEIGPRLPGYPESYLAIEWAADKMKQIGLENVRLQKVKAPHWVRGNSEKAVITGSGRKLNIAALGGSIGTDPAGLTAGVMEVQDFTELELRSDEAIGKIIFYNRPFDKTVANTFAGYSGAVDQRGKGAAMAAKYGGVAAIVRSVTSLDDNTPHVGIMHYADTLKKVPAAAVGVQDADFLSRALKANPHLKINLDLSCRNLPDTTSYNVIGEIRGSEFPEEIIVIGGHFDAWDKACGAHDDGGGCMQALEVLDLFRRMEIQPRRTIRCVLFMDEEQHQSGADRYAFVSDSLQEETLAAIESDRGVFTPRGFSVDSDSLTLLKLQKWQPVLQRCGIDWISAGGSGVDIKRIKNAKAKIGFVPDDARYFDVHHSANDVFEAVHPREMQLGTAAMATLVYLLSEEGL